MNIMLEDIIKLLLAVVIGGLLGAEREYHEKAAGLRTIICICVGATLFTIFSTRLGTSEDPTRIAAGIVTGIGFLGAGVIIRQEGHIRGLTSAATIWIAAALGMGIGGGFYYLSVIAAIIIVIVLLFFRQIENWFQRFHKHNHPAG